MKARSREPTGKRNSTTRHVAGANLDGVERSLSDLGFHLSLAIRFTVETTPPFLSAAARFIVSGAVLYLWRRMCGDRTPSDTNGAAPRFGLFLLVGGNGAVVWAARYIPSSLAALLVATCPLWMLLFDFLRQGGEKPGPRALTGILIGFCGAVLLIGWSANGTTPNSFFGAIVVVFGSLFWAVGSIYGKTAAAAVIPTARHRHGNAHWRRVC